MTALGTSSTADVPLLTHSSPINCSSGGAGYDRHFFGRRFRSSRETTGSSNVHGISTWARRIEARPRCTSISSTASAAVWDVYTIGVPGEFHRPPSTRASSPSKARAACRALTIRQAVITSY